MKQLTSTTYRIDPPFQAVVACQKARRFSLWSLLICALGQLLIDASIDNVICILIVSTMSATTFHLLLKGAVFRALPLPALIVLGFNVSTMSGALIAQTLGLRSLVYNLQVPLITFALCALFQVSLLTALLFFLSSSDLKSTCRTINQRFFSRLGIMQRPSAGQLWTMGFIGSASMLWSATDVSDAAQKYGNVGIQFISGLAYLAFAPFVLPILDRVFPTELGSSTVKTSKLLLLGYTLLLVFIAIIRNSRATFMLGITNLVMGALLLTLMGQLRVTARLRRGLMAGGLAILMLAPLLSDLAIAMLVVRGQRSDVSSVELVTLTLEAFDDKPVLEEYRRMEKLLARVEGYEEDYLANPFVARFVSTKFFDNTLAYEEVRNGAYAGKLWDVTLDKVVALLPTPVLRGLGININKQDLEFSMGDALFEIQAGAGFGGYRTGSTVGHGMGLMGLLMFIAAVPFFLLIFVPFQSLTLTVGPIVVISPVVLLQLISVYGLAAGDSLIDPVSMILRALPQNILIYWLAFHGTRWVSAFRTRPLPSAGPPGPSNAVRAVDDHGETFAERLKL